MPEGGRDAPVLIAISFQALQRQLIENPNTQKADCTVVIVFVGFYLEATVDVIVDQMNMRPQMDAFLNPTNNPHYHPGLQPKLAWFYNEFVAIRKAANKDEFSQIKIYDKLRRKFPGFAKLYKFRNDVSHGKIGRPADSLRATQALRNQAKAIRDSLYAIAQRHDPSVKPDTTYWNAIGSA